MKKSAAAFEQMRYHFERLGDAGDGWWAAGIATATHNRIIELRPAWANLGK